MYVRQGNINHRGDTHSLCTHTKSLISIQLLLFLCSSPLLRRVDRIPGPTFSRNKALVAWARQIMTMRLRAVSAPAAQLVQFLLLIYLTFPVQAETSTTTTTLFSTTTVLTKTVTITTHGRTIETLTTATSTEGISPTFTTIRPTETMSWGSGHGNYSLTALREQALNSTNYFRKQYEAKSLTWDARLAQYGQRHAEKCIWEHSVCSPLEQ